MAHFKTVDESELNINRGKWSKLIDALQNLPDGKAIKLKSDRAWGNAYSDGI